MGYGPVSLVFHILSTQRKECPFLLRFGVSGVGGLGVGGLGGWRFHTPQRRGAQLRPLNARQWTLFDSMIVIAMPDSFIVLSLGNKDLLHFLDAPDPAMITFPVAAFIKHLIGCRQ